MNTFICPECGIEQDDVYIEDGYLFNSPDDRCTWYRCNCCHQKLLPTEVGPFDALYRRRCRVEIIGGVVFWIIVLLLIRCWLS